MRSTYDKAGGQLQTHLRIYLNDHYAGATAGLELAKRLVGNNEGTSFEEPLEKLKDAIEDDRYRLEQLMEKLNVSRNSFKESAGWVGEKFGRLKLNGQLRGYSELSRLEELEGLTLGVEGKLSLWKNLKVMAEMDSRLDESWLESQIDRAEQQRSELEQLRLKAAAELVRAGETADV
jgi:hypothetical protein